MGVAPSFSGFFLFLRVGIGLVSVVWELALPLFGCEFLPSLLGPSFLGVPLQATLAGRGIIDTRIGKPPVFSGDESTWSDLSFKLRSYVSVVDLQLGRMMEAAELAAHAK